MLGQGDDEDPHPPRQGGTELSDEQNDAPAIPAVEIDYGRLDELEVRVSNVEMEVDHLGAAHAASSETVAAVEPWVGPEGQLRVRLERVEQAIFALISDPSNPLTSAAQASLILTTIPTPSA